MLELTGGQEQFLDRPCKPSVNIQGIYLFLEAFKYTRNICCQKQMIRNHLFVFYIVINKSFPGIKIRITEKNCFFMYVY